MITERATINLVNQILADQLWVYKDLPGRTDLQVLKPKVIPKDSGIYWIAGETTLRGGRNVPSVFRTDTNGGGSLVAVFWKIEGKWYRHEDADTLSALKLPREEVFPFDWKYAVPLEDDIFHP